MYFYLKLCHGMSAHNRIELKRKWMGEEETDLCMSLSLIHIIFTLTRARARTHRHKQSPSLSCRCSSLWYTLWLWHGITVNVCTKWQNGEKSNRTTIRLVLPLSLLDLNVNVHVVLYLGCYSIIFRQTKLNELNAQIVRFQPLQRENNYIIEIGKRQCEKSGWDFPAQKFKCFWP